MKRVTSSRFNPTPTQQLEQWRARRLKGRHYLACKYGAGFFGISIFVFEILFSLLGWLPATRYQTSTDYLILLILCLTGGYIWGFCMWYFGEWNYVHLEKKIEEYARKENT